MSILKVDQVELGLSRIIHHNNKENFKKLTALYLEEIQVIEDVLLILSNMKDIDHAFGVWLDYIGRLVGTPRDGRDDIAYRKELYFQISVRSSTGTLNEIISLVKQFTKSTSVEISEGVIASASIFVNGSTNIDNGLYRLVQSLKPIATNWRISADPKDKCFKFAWLSKTTTSITNQYYKEVENRNFLGFTKGVSQFQTTSNGVNFEDFQTTSNGVDYSNFHVLAAVRDYDEDNSSFCWRVTDTTRGLI